METKCFGCGSLHTKPVESCDYCGRPADAPGRGYIYGTMTAPKFQREVAPRRRDEEEE